MTRAFILANKRSLPKSDMDIKKYFQLRKGVEFIEVHMNFSAQLKMNMQLL